MRLRPLHEPHALVYVHGRSGPADQSNENLAAKEDRFVQLFGSSQDLRDFDSQHCILRPEELCVLDNGPRKMMLAGKIAKFRFRKHEPLTGQPLEVV